MCIILAEKPSSCRKVHNELRSLAFIAEAVVAFFIFGLLRRVGGAGRRADGVVSGGGTGGVAARVVQKPQLLIHKNFFLEKPSRRDGFLSHFEWLFVEKRKALIQNCIKIVGLCENGERKKAKSARELAKTTVTS